MLYLQQRPTRKDSCGSGGQSDYHAEILETNWFIKQKINYIHNNPLKEKIVNLPEDYYLSSARNYAGLEYEIEVIVLDLF